MPVIKLNDQQFQLRPGTNRIGGGDFVEMAVSPDVSLGVQAVIEVTGTEGVVIRPPAGKAAVVLVNGVLLSDPTPLLHGDKLEIAGKELSFSDDSKAGATTFLTRADVTAATGTATATAPATAPAPPTGPRSGSGSGSGSGEPIQLGETVRGPSTAVSDEVATVVSNPLGGASGGRLVSLVDGREYTVPETGLTIGRESGSGVVLAHKQVSRKHAIIAPSLRGYEIRDLSSNGVYVNGNKVNGTQLLARTDMIRIAKDEFRFYADQTSASPTRSIQAFAPKPKSTRDTPAKARRTPTSAGAIGSRLAYQDKKRGTPHTPLPATATAVIQPQPRAGRFGWLWAVVLLLLLFAAYYMLQH